MLRGKNIGSKNCYTGRDNSDTISNLAYVHMWATTFNLWMQFLAHECMSVCMQTTAIPIIRQPIYSWDFFFGRWSKSDSRMKICVEPLMF